LAIGPITDLPRLVVPVFSLYGEEEAHDPGLLHIEDIRTRSERYGWEIQPHRHDGLFQCLFLLKGEALFHLGPNTTSVSGPAALIIPPGAVHAFNFQPGSEGHVLTIAESSLVTGAALRENPRLHAFLFSPRQIDLASSPDILERLALLLALVSAEFHTALVAGRVLIDSLIAAILILVWRQGEANAQEDYEEGRRAERFRAFRTLVEQHLLAHWPVQRYAEALQLTERQLHRICRQQAHKSPLDIVQDRLLLEAQRKLIHVAAPVSALAYELGFEDPAYFWRFFKRRAGVTPTAYRERERARVLAQANEEKTASSSFTKASG
jgi:AraC family transcriptional activator of pobA